MKKQKTLTLLSLLTLSAGIAQADFYGSIRGLYDANSNEPGVAGSLGYSFSEQHSIEVELSYINQDSNGIDGTVLPLMFNYRFTESLSDYVEPVWMHTESLWFYAGAGLGVTFLDAEITTPGFRRSSNDAVFSAQGFVGLGYDLNKNTSVIGGYRYLWIDDATLFGVTGDIEEGHILELGISYKF